MRILFVCLGNICRSPLAEVVFSDNIQKAGLQDVIQVDSAGTASYHIGDKADQRSIKTALNHGLEITHRARQVRTDDFQKFDLILGMDQNNVRTLHQMASCDQERAKIHLFRQWDAHDQGDIQDPYYGTMEDFEEVYRLCQRSSEGLLAELSQKWQGRMQENKS